MDLASVANLSDADAATKLSAPVLTPRTQWITLTSLGSFWGVERLAAFIAYLRGMIAAGGASGALADAVLAVLAGTGCNPADPETAKAAAALVLADACTEAEMKGVLYTIAQTTVTEAEVHQARRERAGAERKEAVLAAIRQQQASAFITLAAAWDDWQRQWNEGIDAEEPT
jgi:hypothetical protein